MPPRAAEWLLACEEGAEADGEMELVFTPQSQREACSVEGRSPPGRPGTSSCAACDVPPDSPSKLSRDVIPSLGKVLLGAGPGAHCCQDTFGPAASINTEDFPKLLMALVQVVQALSVLWETTCSCSGQEHTPLLWAGLHLHH